VRQRRVFHTLMVLLILGGMSLLWLRHEQLGIPLIPERQVPVWLVEARVDFDATGGRTLVRLSLPAEPTGFRLVSEQAASPGYGFSSLRRPATETRGSRPRVTLPSPGRFSRRSRRPQRPRTFSPRR